MSKILCGPARHWLDGVVEFWCERHAYGKTVYPTEERTAEERASMYGWKHFKNGSWHCPWCQGKRCKYLDKFRSDPMFNEYLKDAKDRVFPLEGTWLWWLRRQNAA